MKIAYFDCQSGISGDMTLGALIDAGADLARINAALATLGLPGVRLAVSEVKKKGFRATQLTVEHEPEHKHRHLHHITAMIDGSQLTQRAKELARKIFTRLAEAEAKVHGSTIEKVHFHEVGAVDSIADIVGSAIALDMLGIERIVCSPVPTGSGFVEIAHGRCSIPAPATGELLKGVPLAESRSQCELTTPTGAAIVAALAESFGPLPAMATERIGYGAGQRDLEEQANLLRVLIGEASDAQAGQTVWVLETNLDDLSGEFVAHAVGRVWEAGALDVTTTAIQMKKNRPGVTISVLCEAARVSAIEDVLLRETTTLGIRRWPVSRHVLERQKHTVTTPWGPIEGVLAWRDGQATFSPEFESCRQLAEKKNVPLKAVHDAALKAFEPSNVSPLPSRERAG